MSPPGAEAPVSAATTWASSASASAAQSAHAGRAMRVRAAPAARARKAMTSSLMERSQLRRQRRCDGPRSGRNPLAARPVGKNGPQRQERVMAEESNAHYQQRLRDRARRLWDSEGRPSGREERYLEKAREALAIEDNPRGATEPVEG